MKKPKKFIKSVKPQVAALPKKAYKFPSISLNIPEGWLRKAVVNPAFLTAFTAGFLIMAKVIVGYDIYINLGKISAIKYERSVIEAQKNEWKGIVNSYKDYRDGYYQLAVLEYRLGNLNGALDYLQKTLEIDSGFKEAEELRTKIITR